MRRVGSVVIMLLGCGFVAAVWFATPYVTRPNSHLVQFTEVVIAGAMVALGVITIAGGVAMRKAPVASSLPTRAARVASVPLASPQVIHLQLARKYLDAAKERRTADHSDDSMAGELWNLELCVNEMLCMVEKSIPKGEGNKTT